MHAVLSSAFPVFALIFLGWILAKRKILGASTSSALTRYVALIALPALLFKVSSSAPWRDLLNVGVVISVGGGLLICFFTAFFVFYGRRDALRGKGLAGATLDGMNASYSNAGFMGVPLVALLVGETALIPAVTTVLLTASALFSLAVALIAGGSAEKTSWWTVLGRIARALALNPLVFAPVIGMLLSANSIGVPLPISNFVDLLAAAAAPTALVAIGLFLASITEQQPTHSSPNRSAIVWLLSVKMIGQPLITGLLAYFVFSLPPYWAYTLVILSATPIGIGPFMLANLYEYDTRETSLLILLSTLLSVFTISALITWLPAS
ncbi:AEC family transporter [Paenalcaligenes niemegkensis]|uniref:AEC family transporter n=1 Tax=Paenalcaligenes niemegkensis TaxID=2895469 RepID=UPI001EE88E2F|nr:AEC family transporter [Paenalcaligenes niemegkensis]MCQ9618071.1 AEC family transporter [Paenalcaligenes niemegkensis]